MNKKRAILIILTTIMLEMIFPAYCHADNTPLFVFDYDGSHIETYASYSIVDGVMSTSHRYFVKSGNLVVIDQNLNPTANDIFIHFAAGKSYIAVLTRSGSLVSLGTEDLLSNLQEFQNENIKALAENINYDSTMMLITYRDGAQASYDCITGKCLAYQKGSSETESTGTILDFIAGKIDGLIGGIGNNSNNSEWSAGARAQGIVNTLETYNVSIGDLILSGALEGMASDYSNGNMNADSSSGYNFNSYIEEFQVEKAKGSDTTPQTGEDVGTKVVYDYTENAEYQQFMDSTAAEWSEEDVAQFNELIDDIAQGTISAEETREKIEELNRQYLEKMGSENPEVVPGESKGATEDITGEFQDPTESEEFLFEGDDSGLSYLSEEGKEGTDVVLDSVEDAYTEMMEALETQSKEKQFIKTETKNKYVAVYNAEKEAYEIFSQKDILENPQDPENEAVAISETAAESLEKLLSEEETSDIIRGIKLFVVIALAVVAILVVIFILGSRVKKKKVIA